MIRALLIVIAVMSLACTGLGVWSWQLESSNKQLEARNARLDDDLSQYKLTLKSSQNALALLKKSVQSRDELFKKQHEKSTQLKRQLDQKQRMLNDVINKSQVAKDWAGQHVPDAISQLLSTTAESPGQN